MANDKISELPAISSIETTDILPIVDLSATTTKKITITQIAATIPVATGSVAGTMSASDKTKLDAAGSSNTASTIVLRDGSGNAAVNVLTAASVTVTGSPVASTDACNKSYVDAVAVGLTIKSSCNAATVANIANMATGAPSTVDGVTLSVGYRVLVKDQSTATQNGIYSVTTVGSGSNGVWSRSLDADTGAELPTNSYTFVNAGTVNSSTGWVMNTAGAITIGVSNIVWVLFSQITSLPAANITGQLLSTQIADAAISTAKFAAGITPVEILGTLPVSSNFEGRTVYLTTDDKMYRYTGSAFVSTLAAADITGTLSDAQLAAIAAAKITGQITTTQITDGAISTPKLAAGAVTANEIAAATITAAKIVAGTITTTQIATGTIVAGNLAANTITAGKMAAGAIGTTELAAGAVTAAKIAAGTITANEIAANTITAGKLSISTLSSIAANIGTVTSGTIGGLTISSTKISSSSSGTTIDIDASNAWVKVSNGNANIYMSARDPGTGAESYLEMPYSSSNTIKLRGWANGGVISLYNSSNTNTITLTGQTGTVSATLLAATGATILGGGRSTTYLGNLLIQANPGSSDRVEISTGEVPGASVSFSTYFTWTMNGRTVYIPFTTVAP